MYRLNPFLRFANPRPGCKPKQLIAHKIITTLRTTL
jgi:hypothetical protein